MCLYSNLKSGYFEVKEPRPTKTNGLKCLEIGGNEGCDGRTEVEAQVSETNYLQMGLDRKR